MKVVFTRVRVVDDAEHAERIASYQERKDAGVRRDQRQAREIINKLHGGVVRALQDAELRKRFINDGAEPVGGTPEQFAVLIRSDTAKWAKVIKEAGIKPE